MFTKANPIATISTPAQNYSFLSLLLFVTNPLEQFEVTSLPVLGAFGFTNLALTLSLNFVVIFALFGLYSLSLKNNYDVTLRSIYQLVASMVKENLYMYKQIYFTALLYLFVFILMSNLVGMIPYSFTPTSSFAVTFFLANAHFTGLNHVGATQHG
jgi:F0F1-type ATP synthase membrane subunit a